MGIGQRETGRGVVKSRRHPRNGTVAVRTLGNRKYRRRSRMLRIGGLLPRRKVATRMPAVGRRNLQIVVTTDVAIGTGHIGMPVRQGEVDRRSRMVYRSSEPTVERVATRARLRELGTDVVWHVPAHCLSLLVVFQVTRDTSGRKPLELPDRRALMTVFAL